MAKEVWTFGEQTNGRLDTISYELIGRGRALADKLDTKLVSILLGWKLTGMIYRICSNVEQAKYIWLKDPDLKSN